MSHQGFIGSGKARLFFIGFLFAIFAVSAVIALGAGNAKTVHAASPWDGNAASKFASGDGTTEETAYTISTAEELALFSGLVDKTITTYNGAEVTDYTVFNSASVYYKLTANIVLNDTETIPWTTWHTYASEAAAAEDGIRAWKPVGVFDLDLSGKHFKANFDGGGKTVSGVYINNANDYQGLFGNVDGGKISNVGVESSYIKGNYYVGGVAGYIAVSSYYVDGVTDYIVGSVTNCYSKGAVSALTDAGGIAGWNDGTVQNCNNTGSVTSRGNVAGGIAGKNKGTIVDCNNTGAISASKGYTGGIAGNNGGTIENCYNTVAVSTTSDYAGGIAGWNEGTVQKCYNTGIVNVTESYAGGIAGYNNKGTVQNCYNTGAVSTVTDYAGGIAGVNNGTVQNCYNTGNITATEEFAGGIAGGNASTVQNCYNTGNITATVGYAGGIAGGNRYYDDDYPGVITSCFNIGSVNAASNRGGISGINDKGEITTCYYNTETVGTTGAALTGIGTGLTTAQMSGTSHSMTGLSATYWNANENVYTENSIEFKYPSLKAFSAVAYTTVYLITTADQLRDLADKVNEGTDYKDKVFWLSNDIDLENVEFTAIGTSAKQFKGTFDGKGYEIKNLKIDKSGEDNQGLFGYIGEGGVVKNLGVSGSVKGNYAVGGIAGRSEGTIENCYNAVAVIAIDEAGGIAGINKGSIKNCYNAGAITATESYAGGIAASNYGTISNCHNTSAVSTIDVVGGIAGSNVGTIENCNNTGTVSAGGDKAGGITGSNSSTIENCNNTGAVTASGDAGGIAGINSGTIENCNNTGTVSAGGDYAGGIAGTNRGNISNCYNRGNINASKEFAGGIAGGNAGTVQNCYNTGSITATVGYAGGIAGGNQYYNYAQPGVITSCFNIGSVNATSNRGGISGINDKGTITDCYYNTETVGTTGAELTGIGTGLTTAQMSGTSHSMTGLSATYWNPNENVYTENSIEFKYPSLKAFSAVAYTTEYLYGDNGTKTDWGTKSNPYLITTAAQLRYLADRVNEGTDYTGKVFWLSNDIDLESVEFTAIGTSDKQFKGTFDGKGYWIKNLKIDKSAEENQGLFGYIGEGGVVKNLGVSGSVKGNYAVGGIAGRSEGAIENCYNTCAISASDEAGGIAGINKGTIKNCYNAGEITAKRNYAGGITARSDRTIVNCYNVGGVSAANYAGGIAGGNDGTIENCYNAYRVRGLTNFGSIAGYNSGTVSYCYYIDGTIAIGSNDGTASTAVYAVSIEGEDFGEFANGSYIELSGVKVTNILYALNLWVKANQTSTTGYMYFEMGYGNDEPIVFSDEAWYIVDFNTDGMDSGTAPDKMIVSGYYASIIRHPGNEIAKTGYSHGGIWYTKNGEVYEPFTHENREFTADITLYIRWTAEAVTFTTEETLAGGAFKASYNASVSAQTANDAGGTIIYAETGSVLSSFGLSLSSAGVITGTASKAGTCTFTVRATNSASGAFDDRTFSIVIATINQDTLSVDAVSGKKYGDAAFQLATTGGSGTGTVTYTLVSGPATVTSGGLVTITGVGSIVVKATKAADTNYNSSTSVNLTIAVAKAVYAGAAPVAEIEEVTTMSITIKEIVGAKYSIDGGTNWQESGMFTELTAGTKYSVVVQIMETDNYLASDISAAVEVSTAKDGLSGGAIAGIVVGSVAVAGIGGFAIFWFAIKKKSFADLLTIFKK